MEISDLEIRAAEERGEALRAVAEAVSVRYDRRRSRIVVGLRTGVELTFPTRIAQDLADASPDDLAEIEITPAGLGLHWPRLDADLYVPALLQGVFGTRDWMAGEFARRAGQARSVSKGSARIEDAKGGPSRKQA